MLNRFYCVWEKILTFNICIKVNTENGQLLRLKTCLLIFRLKNYKFKMFGNISSLQIDAL